MLRIALTAAALSLTVASAMAQTSAQEHWQVIFGAKGVTLMATVQKNGNIANLRAMAVIDPPGQAMVDRAVSDWAIDCSEKTVNNVSGTGYLNGAAREGAWKSATGGVAVTPTAGSIQEMLFNYGCNGKRMFNDTAVFTNIEDAAAFGLKLARQ